MPAAVQHIEAISGQIVDDRQNLVRLPTVPPPGSHYEDLVALTLFS